MKKRKEISFVKPENDGKEVVISGFVTNIRNVGDKLKFLVVEDWSGDAQITIKEDASMLKLAGELTHQSVIAVKGTVKKSAQTNRGVELLAGEIILATKSEVPLPVDLTDRTESGLSKRLDWRFLDLRPNKQKKIFLIASDFERFVREFFYKNEVMEIHSPKFLGAPSETGAELFSVPYFNKTAYLAQSPQFYKQMAVIAGFENVREVTLLPRDPDRLTP